MKSMNMPMERHTNEQMEILQFTYPLSVEPTRMYDEAPIDVDLRFELDHEGSWLEIHITIVAR
jgi:hypothetical protein